MTARQVIIPGAMPSRDRNGRALPGKLRFYAPGTTTPKTVYTSSALNVAHNFPIASDSAGRWPVIWADDAQSFDVGWSDQAHDKTIATFSDVTPVADAVLASVALADGSADAAAASASTASTAATTASAASAAAVGASATAVAAASTVVTALAVAHDYTDSSIAGLTKANVGLGAADNTADIDKPVSTAQAAAIAAEAAARALGDANALSLAGITSTPAEAITLGYRFSTDAYKVSWWAGTGSQAALIAGIGQSGFETGPLTVWGPLRVMTPLSGVPTPTGELYVPGPGRVKNALAYADGKVFYAIDSNGVPWCRPNGGALTSVLAAAGGKTPEAYTGASTDYTDAFGVDRQPWMYSDPNVVLMFLVVGQSLALGSNPDAGTPVDTARSTSATYPSNALMPSAGVVPYATTSASWAALVERDRADLSVAGSGYTKETICSGFANTLISLVNSKLGFMPTVLMAVAGHGGTPYRGLQRGSDNYAEAIRVVKEQAAIAGGLGKRLVCNLIIEHGEADNAAGMGVERYARVLTQWRANLGAEIQAVTGQVDPVRAYVAQCNRQSTTSGQDAKTPEAALRASQIDPLITCLGPIYDVDADSTATHPYSWGYLKMGTRYAYAVFNDLFDTGYQPLHAVEAYWQTSTTFRIRYNAAVTVDDSGTIIDTTSISATRGFLFVDGSGSPPTVTGVALVAGTTDTVELTLSGASSGLNPYVEYASRNTGGGMGRLTGPRGCIRLATARGTDAHSATVYDWACQESIRPGLRP